MYFMLLEEVCGGADSMIDNHSTCRIRMMIMARLNV